MSVKVASITPFVTPGTLTKNAQTLLDAVLKAENEGAQIINLPKNCFLGESGCLSARTDVSDAVWEVANIVMAKTRATVTMSVPLYGTQMGIIFDKGELKAIKPIANSQSEFAVLRKVIEDMQPHPPLTGNHRKHAGGGDANGECNSNGEYETDECFVKLENERVLDLRGDYFVAVKHKIYEFSPKSGKTTVLAIPASYPALMGGRENKLRETAALSAKNGCVVSVCCCGNGETTSDYVRAGDKIIAQNGQILAAEGFDAHSASAVLNAIDTKSRYIGKQKYGKTKIELPDYTPRYLPKASEITEILDIISRGITGRMREAGAKKLILGLSGGLDSAMALLSALNTQKYGLSPSDIICVTMPSHISSNRTKNNAQKLIAAFSVTGLNIPISAAVTRHLKQINHDKTDVVFENAQARERAQILLNLANKFGALVLGTSDLSEAALGFNTYGGDHLAHYNPNSSLTKSAIRLILGGVVKNPPFFVPAEAKKTLKSILNTPVSPELLKNQRTEDILGDYRLHEYFLLRFMAYGEAGQIIVGGAGKHFKEFSAEYIQKTYETFISRFCGSRFKTDFACDGVMLTPFDFTGEKFVSGLSPELFEI